MDIRELGNTGNQTPVAESQISHHDMVNVTQRNSTNQPSNKTVPNKP